MWLRNKKTGRVFDVMVREKSNGDGEYSIIVCNLRAIRSARSVNCILGEYDSLAKLYEDWEDYKPTEPLIKDEKVRKAVRAWAEANGIDESRYRNVKFDHSEHRLKWVRTIIEFDSVEGLENLDDGKEYTITELCGEEQELEG